MFYYAQIFIITLLLSVALTWLVMKIAVRLGITDRPDSERKIHGRSVPLLGGLAIFAAFFIVLYFVREQLLAGNLGPRHWLGFFVGAGFLMIGGWLDDKYNLKPAWQIIWPALAITSLIIGGVEIEKITNPLGGFIYLGAFSTVLIALWLLGMMYATKLLDGLDGLVSGMTAIGAFIIFALSLSSKTFQPDVAMLALALCGAALGFLIWNFHPAKIFLGEGGSVWTGFMLGVLAISLIHMAYPDVDGTKTLVGLLAACAPPEKSRARARNWATAACHFGPASRGSARSPRAGGASSSPWRRRRA